jgi:glutamate-ammonia-ligase adenylyltransferase
MERELSNAVSRARGFEDVLDIARRWAGDKTFRVGVQILRNITKADAAGPIFSDIADAAIRVLQPLVEGEFAARHGRLPGGAMAVLGLGKLGGREMTVGSDLDLVFVYQAADGAELSDGARPLPPHDYFARLSRRLINALAAETAEGKLFEVDMRLRPSGTAGPIASSIEAFVRYQHESAWTWEHMALTRARVVTGPPGLEQAITAAIRDVLTRARDEAKLAADVAEMRARMAHEHPARSLFDVKPMRGGLIDVEFIAQYLLLRHAHDNPGILAPNTMDALQRVARAGLIDARAGDDLVAALKLWQRLQGAIRLCYRDGFDPEKATEGARRILVEAAEAPDFAALEKKMEDAAAAVRAYFHDLVEAPAGAAAATPKEAHP